MNQREYKTDAEIVEAVNSGHRALFSVLVSRHQRGVLRLCVRFLKDLALAEDVTQESFIKAYERLVDFQGRSSFKSWLYQIAVNTAKNKLRQNSREGADIDRVRSSVGPEAETQLTNRSLSELIHKFVDKLPHKQKTVLTLRVFEDLSFQEIAGIMDCAYDTAKANYRHALLNLREEIHRSEGEFQWTESPQIHHTLLPMEAEV